MYIYNKLCTYIYFYFKIIIYLLGQKKIGKNVLNNVSYFQTASSEKSQNIRKAPSKPQGKFFLTSPKERLKNQKKNSKLAKLKRTEDSWFEMDSIFGFEDQSYKIDFKFAGFFSSKCRVRYPTNDLVVDYWYISYEDYLLVDFQNISFIEL